MPDLASLAALLDSLPGEPGVEADEECCPICLGALDHEAVDVAQLSCGHCYCLQCVLRWAAHKGDGATCALCKVPIGAVLYCARDLLGNRLEHAVEQPLVLLQRARWLNDKGGDDAAAEEAQDSPEEEFDDLDDDDELLVAGPNAQVRRALLANRRFGSGGILRSGRMYARVVQPPPPAPSSSGAGPSSASKPQQNCKPAAKSAQKEKREAKAALAAEKEAAKRERLRERLTAPRSRSLSRGDKQEAAAPSSDAVAS